MPKIFISREIDAVTLSYSGRECYVDMKTVKMGCAIALAWTVLAAMGGVSAAELEAASGGKGGAAVSGREPAELELQGKVVCLVEEMHRLYGTQLPGRHEHVYGFETKDGTCYSLLRTKYSEALFADERVRTKELLLKGRVFPKTQILDVTRTRSVRNDVIYDLYYYCSVCHIESVSPGPCECCQGPVELTEKPLSRGGAARAAE
jgi:hypothetical protein